MKRLVSCMALFCLFALSANSQKIVKVHGEYVYHAPENVSIEEAKRTAVERAKIQALADEFGTTVYQSNSTVMQNENGSSSVDFLSLSGSEVKGEWIETIGEPDIDISYEQNFLIVRAVVEGRAREMTSHSISCKAKILRNGTEDKYESADFRNGDDLYISFMTPVEGYLAIYLVDAERNAFCLLPYRNQTNGIYKTVANHPYLFFNIEKAPAPEKPYVDEYVMTCAGATEQNMIFLIFSPTPFTKAVDESSMEDIPRNTSFADFQRWLTKCRKQDENMQVMRMPISIRN